MMRNRGSSVLAAVLALTLGSVAFAGHEGCATCRQAAQERAAYAAAQPKPCGPVRKLVWWAKKPKTTHVHVGVCGWQFDSRTRLSHAD